MFRPIAVISTLSRTNYKWMPTVWFFVFFIFSLSNSFQAAYSSQSWKVGENESDQGLDAFGRRFQ